MICTTETSADSTATDAPVSEWADILIAARKKGKSNRKAAYMALQRLVELVEFPPFGKHLDALAELAAFFEPRSKAKPKTDFEWVSRATSGRTHKPEWVYYVRAVDGLMYATDGFEARCAETPLADGFYHPDGTRVGDSDKYAFPDMSRYFGTDVQVAPVGELSHAEPDGQTRHEIIYTTIGREKYDHARVATLLDGWQAKAYSMPDSDCIRLEIDGTTRRAVLAAVPE